MENNKQSQLTNSHNIFRAVLQKAIMEPTYFNSHKPLNQTKFMPRDKKGLGLQLRMSV